MDAKLPKPGTGPNVRSHRQSVFTFFDGLGWHVEAKEAVTAVCPRRICVKKEEHRPPIWVQLLGNRRPGRLQGWIDSIGPRKRPTFFFQHALLPHGPWMYLPSGRQDWPTGVDLLKFIDRPPGFHDRDLTLHNHQRYLLQVGYVDYKLGVLLDRLKRTGVMDRTTLVVMADHGLSFEVGVPDRRKVTNGNIDEIATIPLFIKRPGQRKGEVDRSYVRSIDVIPTIADVLGKDLGWRHDGRSVFSGDARGRHQVRLVARDFSHTLSISSAALERRRHGIRSQRARLFGTGFDSTIVYGDPWAKLYRAGSHPELLGRRPRPLRRRAPVRARLTQARFLRKVGRTGIFPTRLVGELNRRGRGRKRDLAVAANGRIVATGRSFYLAGDPREYFSLMIPETSLHRGNNRVRIYQVIRGDRLLTLR
jgi:hypothetical protein